VPTELKMPVFAQALKLVLRSYTTVSSIKTTVPLGLMRSQFLRYHLTNSDASIHSIDYHADTFQKSHESRINVWGNRGSPTQFEREHHKTASILHQATS
ncbi:MAG TPA: hypothetical protein PKI63_04305, partial [Candidatus Cloacimonadota bacterium]|nr:hypothetical protein [Candidatus Cloacimonadota bacterium]HOH78724.1 hypothetical protein [Candidatus Cloacimonadota bacterium]